MMFKTAKSSSTFLLSKWVIKKIGILQEEKTEIEWKACAVFEIQMFKFDIQQISAQASIPSSM